MNKRRFKQPKVSHIFHSSKRGSKGRRLTRHLSDKHVMLAQIAAMNPEHQAKFKPKWRTKQ